MDEVRHWVDKCDEWVDHANDLATQLAHLRTWMRLVLRCQRAGGGCPRCASRLEQALRGEPPPEWARDDWDWEG